MLVLAVLTAGCSNTTNTPKPLDEPRDGSLLVFSDLRGTIKPCGCSPDLRRGGLARITHHVERARRADPKLKLFHAGNLFVDDEGVPEVRAKQVVRRSETIVDGLNAMGLTATTLGPYDLKQGPEWLRAHLEGVKASVVLTNVEGPGADLGRRSMIVPVGGIRLGVIGLVPPGPDGILDPKTTADPAARALKDRGADVVLALSSLGLRNSKRTMRKLEAVDVMLAGGLDLKAIVSDEVEEVGRGHVVQSFVQGGQVGRLSLALDGTARFALTPIGWDLPQDEAVAKLMSRYDSDLKEINLASAGTLPPLAPGQASYVGVEACLDCHSEAEDFWKHDKHEKAWETLERDNKTFDLECVGCHATGYGKAGGSILGDMKNLVDVQCEQCHGPGSLHAEDGDPETIRKVVPETVCVECHNEKHSTRFEYGKYRSRLLVPGHGKP